MKNICKKPEYNDVLNDIIADMMKFNESEICYFDGITDKMCLMRIDDDGDPIAFLKRKCRSNTINIISADEFVLMAKSSFLNSISEHYFYEK